MKIDKGCRIGYLYLSAYFRREEKIYLTDREFAVLRTRALARVAKEININCPYLSCTECPKKLFFKHLEDIDVYREEKYPF